MTRRFAGVEKQLFGKLLVNAIIFTLRPCGYREYDQQPYYFRSSSRSRFLNLVPTRLLTHMPGLPLRQIRTALFSMGQWPRRLLRSQQLAQAMRPAARTAGAVVGQQGQGNLGGGQAAHGGEMFMQQIDQLFKCKLMRFAFTLSIY